MLTAKCLHKPFHFAKLFFQFFYDVTVDFLAGNGLDRSASLAYTIVLSIVPLLIVSFSLISVSPEFLLIFHRLELFVFRVFLPHTGQTILNYILAFQEQAKNLSWISFIFLSITAVMMLVTMETHINELWKVKDDRHFGSALLVHWVILVVGPFLLCASLFLTSFIFTLPFSLLVLRTTPSHLFFIPFLFSVLAYTFLYKTIPACTVKLGHALLGGLFSGILFELAKIIFIFYIEHFSNYTLIYGTLATIPIFLIWLYFCALIFLFGAQIVNGLRIRGATLD